VGRAVVTSLLPADTYKSDLPSLGELLEGHAMKFEREKRTGMNGNAIAVVDVLIKTAMKERT